MPILQRLAVQHVSQQAAQRGAALPIADEYDPHFEPDTVQVSSDGSLLLRPASKPQLPFRKSSSSHTFPSSTEHSASHHSGSWPPRPAAQRMAFFAHNVWPDAIDASPSPHRARAPAQPALPSAFCAVHDQKQPAQQGAKDMRKICSCTALSTYQPQSAASSASGRKQAGLRGPAPPQAAAKPSPAPLSPKAASQPELLLRHSASGSLPEAQSKSTPVMQEPAPRKSLLTLAEAAAASTDSELPSAGPEQLPAAEAQVPRGAQPGAAAAAGAAEQAVQPAHAAHEPLARTGTTPEDTPFSKLSGLPAALHREAGACGFHKPVKVTMGAAAGAPASSQHAAPPAPRHTVHATPLARQTRSQAGGAQLRLPVFGLMGSASRRGSRQKLASGSGSK